MNFSELMKKEDLSCIFFVLFKLLKAFWEKGGECYVAKLWSECAACFWEIVLNFLL